MIKRAHITKTRGRQMKLVVNSTKSRPLAEETIRRIVNKMPGGLQRVLRSLGMVNLCAQNRESAQNPMNSAADSRLPLETEGCSRSDKAVGGADKPFKEYVCRYFHDGSWWSLDLMARDFADAEARCRKLGNLQLLGEVKMRIPAFGSGAGWLPRAICAVRNWWWNTREG